MPTPAMYFPLRRVAAIARAALVAAPLALAGCFGGWGGSGGGGPVDDAPVNGRGDGRVSIAWTIDGEVPSDARCAGAAEVELELDYDDGARVRIAPIPCALDRFRYDNLHEGRALLTLRVLDENGCSLGEGDATITVRAALPPAPSPTVAIPALTRCR